MGAAAWATPVIVLSAAAPVASASVELASMTVIAPPATPYIGFSSFLIQVVNDSTTDIPARRLIARIPFTDPSYSFNGFSGQNWDYGPQDPSGASLAFAYTAPVAAGATTTTFLLILGNQAPDQTPPPSATLTFTALGFAPASTELTLLQP
jgi:hypothetical protein